MAEVVRPEVDVARAARETPSSMKGMLRLSTGEMERKRKEQLRSARAARVGEARRAEAARCRGASRAARLARRAKDEGNEYDKCLRDQELKRDALADMQETLVRLREEMGAAHADGAQYTTERDAERLVHAYMKEVNEEREMARFSIANADARERRYARQESQRIATRRLLCDMERRTEDRAKAHRYYEDVIKPSQNSEAEASTARSGLPHGAMGLMRPEDYRYTRIHQTPYAQKPLCFRFGPSSGSGDDEARKRTNRNIQSLRIWIELQRLLRADGQPTAAELARAVAAKKEEERTAHMLQAHASEERAQSRFDAALRRERLAVSQQGMETTLEKCARYERINKSKVYSSDLARLNRSIAGQNRSNGGFVVQNPSLNVDAALRNNVDAAFDKAFGLCRGAVPIAVGNEAQLQPRSPRGDVGDAGEPAIVKVPTKYAADDGPGVLSSPTGSGSQNDRYGNVAQKVNTPRARDAAYEDDLSSEPSSSVPGIRSSRPAPYQQWGPSSRSSSAAATLASDVPGADTVTDEPSARPTESSQSPQRARRPQAKEAMTTSDRVSHSSLSSSTLSSMISAMEPSSVGNSTTFDLDEELNLLDPRASGGLVTDDTDYFFDTVVDDPLRELSALDEVLSQLSREVRQSHQSLVHMSLLPESPGPIAALDASDSLPEDEGINAIGENDMQSEYGSVGAATLGEMEAGNANVAATSAYAHDGDVAADDDEVGAQTRRRDSGSSSGGTSLTLNSEGSEGSHGDAISGRTATTVTTGAAATDFSSLRAKSDRPSSSSSSSGGNSSPDDVSKSSSDDVSNSSPDDVSNTVKKFLMKQRLSGMHDVLEESGLSEGSLSSTSTIEEA